jgi:hypothetical protein
MVGRNHACPCGSGKKYKKCCERSMAISIVERESRNHEEILVQREQYQQQADERRDLMVREKEREMSSGQMVPRAQELESSVLAPPAVMDSTNAPPFWPTIELKAEEQILSQRIMQQLEQFFLEHVLPLQKRTRLFYSESLELLHKYLSIYYGKKFDWLMLNEDVLLHFLSVWYLDHGKITPNRCKIFLNTLKQLFRWLQAEEIADVYPIFKKEYPLLIHALPMTVEVRKWLLQHAVPFEQRQLKKKESSDVHMLSFSETNPVLFIEEKWIPISLPDFHFTWADHRFWVKGSIEIGKFNPYFTQVEGVYPVIALDKPFQVQALGNE